MSRADLEKELGGKLPLLDALTPVQARELLHQVRAARIAQERALQKVFDETLDHLPLLLRLPVRKLFERAQ